jgi:hypothetical protein
MTGGVRAGAPAARQGYGSLVPRGDLNAGRKPLDLPRTPLPGGARGGAGLLPSLARPAIPGRGAPTVPQPPAPPAVQPRVTAEDIGGF